MLLQANPAVFRAAWPRNVSRPWPGPDYWSNPLQDWRIDQGRLECVSPGGDRNVVLLTREVAERSGTLTLSVQLGQIQPQKLENGFVGFRVGAKSPMNDYRAAAIYGRGLDAGIHFDGTLFIGSLDHSAPKVDLGQEIRLELNAHPSANGYSVSLGAASAAGTQEITREVPEDWLNGMLALVCSSAPVEPTPSPFRPIQDFSFYPPQQKAGGTMRCWFKDWTIAGSKVDEHNERAYGPILFTLYTISRKISKLSAQFPPLVIHAPLLFWKCRMAGPGSKSPLPGSIPMPGTPLFESPTGMQRAIMRIACSIRYRMRPERKSSTSIPGPFAKIPPGNRRLPLVC